MSRKSHVAIVIETDIHRHIFVLFSRGKNALYHCKLPQTTTKQLNSHYGVSLGYFPLEQCTLLLSYEPVLHVIRVTFSLHVFLCQRIIRQYT